MVKVGIVHFDELGIVRTDLVDVPRDKVDLCWKPARFLGGQCDRCYVCKVCELADCKAYPSGIAREKLEEALENDQKEGEGEEIMKTAICAICNGPIVPKYPKDDYVRYYGGKGTHYGGQPICENCYDEDLSEPCATVYFGDSDEPRCIGSCRDETEGSFRVKWHSTDPWRGYYECESDRYLRVFDDAILSGHESEEMLKELYDKVIEQFNEEGIDYCRVFCRSSNVFMTCLEIWVTKDPLQLLKALLIVSQVKGELDYDNPLYCTGILFPRESLEQFKKLLGNQYEITTDKDMWDLAARKGEDLIREVADTVKKEAHNG